LVLAVPIESVRVILPYLFVSFNFALKSTGIF
jgi:hypothetical protein